MAPLRVRSRGATPTLVSVATAATILIATAASLPPPAGAGRLFGAGSPVYLGTPADACPTVGAVLSTCACQEEVAASPRLVVVAPPPPAGRGGTACALLERPDAALACHPRGGLTCAVTCAPPRPYCAFGSLGFDAKTGGGVCACALSGNVKLVVRK